MLSVIIPTLNEADTLPATVAQTRAAATNAKPIEIVLSDCHSRDGTLASARHLPIDRIVIDGSCRADALNRGSAAARGDVLLFLHADSILPARFDESIERALTDPRIVGGAFDFQFGPDDGWRAIDRHGLSFVVLCNRARYRWTGNFYGDQSIFVRRDVFQRIGGFPRVTLLEDIGFCRRMRRAGRTAILRPPVVTSPRRFLARGVVRQFLEDVTLLAFDSVGLRPPRFWTRYNQLNRDAHGAFHRAEPSIRLSHAAT